MPSPFALRFWAGHLIMVVLLAAAVLLGLWQFSVYQQHRADAATDRTRDTPVALADALGPDQAFPGDAVGRPVEVAGTWLGHDTVFVSGQEQGGRDGYWMVTPMTVTTSGSAMPVVLGWVADPAAAPTPPSGPAQLTAWLQPSQADATTDGSDGSGGTSGIGGRADVLPDLQTAELVQRVDGDLYDGYAVAQRGVGGLTAAQLPKLPDAGTWTALRNLLYGVQWWVFGGFVVLMWWRWLADTRAEQAQAAQGAMGEGPVSTVKV